MTCPHLMRYPWGRDDEAAICALDDGPCDVTRTGFCDRWEKEGVLTDMPYRYKIIARDKRGEWHEVGRYPTMHLAQRSLPGACGARYTEAKIVPI